MTILIEFELFRASPSQRRFNAYVSWNTCGSLKEYGMALRVCFD